jgi:hypothetical protein
LNQSKKIEKLAKVDPKSKGIKKSAIMKKKIIGALKTI